MFLELFSVSKIARKFEGSEIKEKRIAHLNSFSATDDKAEKFNRGCRGGPYINALARFYSYPMLSTVDPLWPSFVRFFVENTLDYSYGDLDRQNRTMWPYTFDGVHLSCKGHAFVADEILIPFFKHQMKPRKLEHPIESSRIEEYGIRMFSPSTYKIPISKWSTWGSHKKFGMPSPAELNESWNITYLDNGRHSLHDGHDCYGSRGNVTIPGVFQFKVPSFCQNCSVGLSYLHSWNHSYVGDVKCEVYKFVKGNKKVHVGTNGTVLFLGNKYQSSTVTGTVSLETVLRVNLAGGKYRIECFKLDSLFSCFTGLTVYQAVGSVNNIEHR